MANIIVGPIIGEVTDTSARVLVELDGDAEITCLAIDAKGLAYKQKKTFRRNFGVIVARVPKSGLPKIEGTLFEADKE